MGIQDKEDQEWTDWVEKFSVVYDKLNYSGVKMGIVRRCSHALTEKTFGNNIKFEKVLEVGAGTGKHLPFVKHQFDEYLMSDHNGDALKVAENNLKDLHPGKLRYEVLSGSSLPFPDNTFDRLIATHVLEHIYQPHLVLKEWARVVKPGGVLSIQLPTDPGVLWRIGRHFGPRKNATKLGFAYDYAMAREHVNSCNNLVAFLRFYFSERKEYWWPFSIPSMDINLFFVCHAYVKK